MRNKIYLIVEGDGEATAAPLLIRRILHDYIQRSDLITTKNTTLNAKGRDNLIKHKFDAFLEYTRRNRENCAGVIVLLDAEKENVNRPVELAKKLAKRARKLKLPFPVGVAVAVCEYESWFLINLDVIAPKYFPDGLHEYEGNPEEQCSAKGWLSRQMPKGQIYKETIHQVKMTAEIDINKTANESPSFKRLIEAVEMLALAIDNGDNSVTP